MAGISVTLVLTHEASSSTASTTCGNPSSSTGVGQCSYTASDLQSWFADSDTGSATAQVFVQYSSVAAASTDVMTVALSQRATYSVLSAAGMVLAMPMSPRMQGETFSSDLSANTGGYSLTSFLITLAYSHVALEINSYSGDSKYNTPVVENDESSGTFTASVVGLSSSTTVEDVTGSSVSVFQISFRVKSDAVVQTYSEAVSCLVESMVNNAGFTYLSNEPAQVNAEVSGAQTVGQLTVTSTALVGIYAYPSTAELFNTAYLNGEDLTSSVVVKAVYSSGSDTTVTSATCSFAGEASTSYASVSGCTVRVSSSHTAGTAALELTAAYDSFSVTLPVRVWFPGSVSVTAAHPVMRAIQGAHQEASCATPLYQTSPLTALATFGGDSLSDAEVDVTCLVTFESAAPSVVEVSGALAQGMSAGSASIGITGGSSDLSVSAAVTVSADEVAVEALHGVLTTGASWYDVPSSVSMSASEQFTASATLEQSLTNEEAAGPVFFWASMTDGAWQQVTPTSGLSVAVNESFLSVMAVEVSAEMITGTVRIGSDTSSGDMLVGTWIDACTNGTIGAGTAPITVTLVPPVSATVSSRYTKVTHPGDSATSSPISMPTRSDLTVTMTYEDGTTKDFTSDARTQYTIISGSSLAAMENSTVAASTEATGSGEVQVQVSFPSYASASSITAEVTLEVVIFDSLGVTAKPYPSYSGSANTDTLKQVQCTGKYQRARATVTASLSDASAYDVTSQSTSLTSSNTAVLTISGTTLESLAVGAASVEAVWSSQGALLNMSVTDTPAAVSSIVHTTSWSSGESFVGSIEDTQFLSVRVYFDDGTQFSDAVSGVSWISASEYLQFTSAADDRISVSSDAVVTLLDNYHTSVRLEASSTCGDGIVTDLVSGTDEVYPNLSPALGDVDLGNQYGVQFTPLATGEDLTISVRVNAQSANLLAFQVVVEFDTTHLAAQECVVGSDWSGYSFICTINDPPNEALVVGSTADSTVSGSAVDVATLTLRGVSAAAASTITGVIQKMIREDGEDAATVIVAGTGAVAISSSKRRALSWDPWDSWGVWGGGNLSIPTGAQERNHRAHLLSANLRRLQQDACDSTVYGDSNGDCVFDVGDVLNVQRYVARKQGYTDLSALTEFQRQQMDPTLDYLRLSYDASNCNTDPAYGTPCPNTADAQYMLRAVGKKLRFLVTPSAADVANFSSVLQVTALVYDHASLPAATQTAVRVEIGTSLNTDMVFTQGTDTTSTTDGVMATAANTGSGYYAVTATGGSCGFAAESDVGVVIMIQTFDAAGASSEDRQYVFFGSAVSPFGEGGYSFDPFTAADIQQSSDSLCAPPTAVPSAAPTTAHPVTAAPSAAPTTSNPTSSLPTATPTTEAPTSTPTTSMPTATRTPTGTPTTALPTSAPTTSTPTTSAPTTAPTTAHPTTAAPSATPTTVSPSMTPTTSQPTSTFAPSNSPTTAAPSATPTTSHPTSTVPTATPTTESPTPAPTTSTPTATRSPTGTPTTPAPTTAPTIIGGVHIVVSVITFSSQDIASFSNSAYASEFSSAFTADMSGFSGVPTTAVTILSIVSSSVAVSSQVQFPYAMYDEATLFNQSIATDAQSIFTSAAFDGDTIVPVSTGIITTIYDSPPPQSPPSPAPPPPSPTLTPTGTPSNQPTTSALDRTNNNCPYYTEPICSAHHLRPLDRTNNNCPYYTEPICSAHHLRPLDRTNDHDANHAEPIRSANFIHSHPCTHRCSNHFSKHEQPIHIPDINLAHICTQHCPAQHQCPVIGTTAHK
ncbi:hypothetical protein CYMTET_13314 [Cymbomonas tetramitiformis]|uniref:Transmembrane protein family 132 fourth domain-containing protein n=1 Tax=Cymbomonas tetramitiformis TaxID=36881 RepID=A0AAE0GIX6_9CHLO|nr:hypothetical protein CYMTET_13314 [Cymbomonas tetramitiformis]